MGPAAKSAGRVGSRQGELACSLKVPSSKTLVPRALERKKRFLSRGGPSRGAPKRPRPRQHEPRGVGVCRHLARERLHQRAQPLRRAGHHDRAQSAPPRIEDVRLGAAYDNVVGRQEALLLAARELLVQRPLADPPPARTAPPRCSTHIRGRRPARSSPRTTARADWTRRSQARGGAARDAASGTAPFRGAAPQIRRRDRERPQLPSTALRRLRSAL